MRRRSRPSSRSRPSGVRAPWRSSAAGLPAQSGCRRRCRDGCALTRIGASSTASVCTSPVTPPFTVVTVVEPGYGRRSASPPKSRIDASSVEARRERVHDLRVADELERRRAGVARRDVVVARSLFSSRSIAPSTRRSTAPTSAEAPRRSSRAPPGRARARAHRARARDRRRDRGARSASRPVMTTSRPRAA